MPLTFDNKDNIFMLTREIEDVKQANSVDVHEDHRRQGGPIYLASDQL